MCSHRRQILYRKSAVPVRQVTAIRRGGDCLTEMPVIASGIHVVDVIVQITVILQPAAFVDVERGGVIEALVRIESPVHVVQKFRDNISAAADVFKMRLV